MKGLHIIATGHYAPERIVTNDDLSKMVDTTDEWITTRTGMKKRHFCGEKDSNVTLAVAAATRAIAQTDIDVNEIGVVVVATFSGDYLVPSAACLLQKELELSDDIICFDLNAACSGFVFGLETIRGLLMQCEKKYGLLVGSECISRHLDMTDRSSCILFGDGAGAAVIELDDSRAYTSLFGCHGDLDVINCTNKAGERSLVHMEGQATYKFAVSTVPKLIESVVKKAGLTLDDIDVFICHQANARIVDAVARHLKLPKDKFFMNLHEYANTSAASLAIALSDAIEKGICKRGQTLLLAGFGAGKTWGAVVIDF